MHVRNAARWLSILLDVRRELPRYAWRHVAYATLSRVDADWLERPEVVRCSPRVGDFSLEVVPRDEIGRFIYLYGVWDLLGSRLLRGFLRSGMTMLDVGANIGYFSVLGGSLVGHAGRVYSFEPHEQIRSRLTRNVARNHLSNIEVRAEAVTSKSGETAFYPSADPTNQGISSTLAGSAARDQLRERDPVIVPALRLDDIAAEVAVGIDLIKLDVEGAERAALEGGERMLAAADAPLVVFEAYDLDSCADVLESSGYAISRLVHDRRRGLRLAEITDDPEAGEPNYVASKQHHQQALSALRVQ
jgi:FkbM family methyltransferase